MLYRVEVVFDSTAGDLKLTTLVFTENQVKGGSVFGQLPAHTNSSEQCFTIPFLKDDIMGNDRHFFARLDIDERSYPTGVIIINPTVTVIIHDTSVYNTDIVTSSTTVEQ